MAYFQSYYFAPPTSTAEVILGATATNSPYIRVSTNSTGSDLTLQLTAPVNVNYDYSILTWRRIGKDLRDQIATQQVISGSTTISNLEERMVYEIFAVPVGTNGVPAGNWVSNCLLAIPSSGSIREKILDRIAVILKTVLADEQAVIVDDQIQAGHRKFRGKFRGVNGAVVIDGADIEVEPYTTDARLVTYGINVHVGWQDKRMNTVVEDALGDAAQSLRLLLDSSQDATIPNLIEVEVTSIPFESDVFDIGENVRGFALRAEYQVQECMTAI